MNEQRDGMGTLIDVTAQCEPEWVKHPSEAVHTATPNPLLFRLFRTQYPALEDPRVRN